LKFIGGGVLAIFPVAAARAGMAHLDAARQAQGLPPLPFGAALHLGEHVLRGIAAPGAVFTLPDA